MSVAKDPFKMLLPALLAMDVYHRDVDGGLKNFVLYAKLKSTMSIRLGARVGISKTMTLVSLPKPTRKAILSTSSIEAPSDERLAQRMSAAGRS